MDGMEFESGIQVGSKLLAMTVTSFFIGEVVKVDYDKVVLKSACWVGCTGEFKKFLAEGVIDAWDPIPSEMLVTVYRQSMVNSMEWPHALPGHDKRKKGGK